MSAKPLLAIERLSVTYAGADHPAVEAMNLTVTPGEILALVGESGSGKSTVALAVGRLLPSTARVSGRIMLEDVDVLAATEAELRRLRGGRVSYVFQDPSTSLNPVLTIGEQLTETILLHTTVRGAEARRRATEWLTRVGIATPAARLDAYPHEFSGGMQQRACIAMALAAEPALLIADEPTTALDVTVQVQILRLLRDLQRVLGLAVLLISHDLSVVESVAHRVGVMCRGRLVELGHATQVLRQPADPHTQELLRCRALLSLEPRGVAGPGGRDG